MDERGYTFVSKKIKLKINDTYIIGTSPVVPRYNICCILLYSWSDTNHCVPRTQYTNNTVACLESCVYGTSYPCPMFRSWLCIV